MEFEKEDFSQIMSKTGSIASCFCKTCQGMCKKVPCIGTPDEMEKIIDAGFASKLMIQDFVGTNVLCPAAVGNEMSTRDYNNGKCSFQDSNGLCVLHDLGLKPYEGRMAYHCNTKVQKETDTRWDTVKLWGISDGIDSFVIAKWRNLDEIKGKLRGI